MATKKNEVGALKTTTGGHRYEDRFAAKSGFDQITVDPKSALYIFYMLRSPEVPDVVKGVAALDSFARRSIDNLKLLSSLGIFEHLFPLIHHSDRVVKRFSQKLLGMLCCLEDFRDTVLKVNGILQLLVDSLQEEQDEVVQEYITLTLAELSKDYYAASKLLGIEDCIGSLFLKIQSFDPDIQKNCLDIMINLLNLVNGIDCFMKNPLFNIRLILDLTSSSYSVIQANALEALKQLTDGNRDPKIMLSFREEMGVETIMTILENKDWRDLHESAIEVFTNITENADLCDYMLISGVLGRLISLLDDDDEDKTMIFRFIGILAKLTNTIRGRKALHLLAMDKRFVSLLNEDTEKVQEYSCYAIANLAQYLPSLNDILEANPIDRLMSILINQNNTSSLKNLAAYTLSILCKEGNKAAETLLNNEKYENLFHILSGISIESVDLCQNLIQIFMGISQNEKLRVRLVDSDFFLALLDCLIDDEPSLKKTQSLQVDVLECFSQLLLENEARLLFTDLNGSTYLIDCLRSRFASVREWAGHVVLIMAQNEDFVKDFIQHNGIKWMLKEKNTMYSMPSWQSAIDAIFRQNLSAKFSYLGRLDLHDITKDGFFIFSNPCINFILLEDFFQSKLNPLFPIYFINFSNENLFSHLSKTSTSKTDNFDITTIYQKELQLRRPRNTLKKSECLDDPDDLLRGAYNQNEKFWDEVVEVENFFVDTLDPYLSDYVIRLKKMIERLESFYQNPRDVEWYCLHPHLIAERARIIAHFVAEEMSGPNPDPSCNAQYKISHINEMKFSLGTHIIPLGFIRIGDYLERAMLFKALADRIGFPCTLVRGSQGRAWNEIALPVIDVENPLEKDESVFEQSNNSNIYFKGEGESQSETTSFYNSNDANLWCRAAEKYKFPKLRMECFKAFPKNFLKPNAVIDLVDEPGRILPLNSLEAQLYCGFVQI